MNIKCSPKSEKTGTTNRTTNSKQ